MLPEAASCGFLAAVAGGVIGGFIGRALALAGGGARAACRASRCRPRWSRWSRVVIYADADLGRRPGPRATVTLTDVKPPPQREVDGEVQLDPPTPPTTRAG